MERWVGTVVGQLRFMHQRPETAALPFLKLTDCILSRYGCHVRVRSIAHKGLRRLYDDNASKGLSADAVGKLRKILAFLDGCKIRKSYAPSRRGKRTS